ncbi:unnamed protein product [Closterium sp. NIES-54]
MSFSCLWSFSCAATASLSPSGNSSHPVAAEPSEPVAAGAPGTAPNLCSRFRKSCIGCRRAMAGFFRSKHAQSSMGLTLNPYSRTHRSRQATRKVNNPTTALLFTGTSQLPLAVSDPLIAPVDTADAVGTPESSPLFPRSCTLLSSPLLSPVASRSLASSTAASSNRSLYRLAAQSVKMREAQRANRGWEKRQAHLIASWPLFSLLSLLQCTACTRSDTPPRAALPGQESPPCVAHTPTPPFPRFPSTPSPPLFPSTPPPPTPPSNPPYDPPHSPDIPLPLPPAHARPSPPKAAAAGGQRSQSPAAPSPSLPEPSAAQTPSIRPGPASLLRAPYTTTLTPLSVPVPVRLADPSGGAVLARSFTVLYEQAKGSFSDAVADGSSHRQNLPSEHLHPDCHHPHCLLLLLTLSRQTILQSVVSLIPLPPPHESSLPAVPDPESDLARAASPTVPPLLATVVIDPSFESTVASALVAELVGCLIHRPEHWEVAKMVLRYLCSTSGMGLVLGGRGPYVLTGHADASWVDDLATQRSSQGYTSSLGSSSVSWRSTRSPSVLSSSCEAEIYARAMAAQELRWLTYLLTDLGEWPRSSSILYVDNNALIALCQEHRLEHRTKHIALRYFLARELQQRGQLRLAYVATPANTADIFTKVLEFGDHQHFCTF